MSAKIRLHYKLLRYRGCHRIQELYWHLLAWGLSRIDEVCLSVISNQIQHIACDLSLAIEEVPGLVWRVAGGSVPVKNEMTANTTAPGNEEDKVKPPRKLKLTDQLYILDV